MQKRKKKMEKNQSKQSDAFLKKNKQESSKILKGKAFKSQNFWIGHSKLIGYHSSGEGKRWIVDN